MGGNITHVKVKCIPIRLLRKNKNIKESTTMNQQGKTEPQSKRGKKERKKKKPWLWGQSSGGGGT